IFELLILEWSQLDENMWPYMQEQD
ncbi:uncharacterized, partial [Tachysurus ichikawai]